jgi:hypothetical protein
MKFNSLKEAMSYIASTIQNEGFEYTFCSYSSFDCIKDEEFHRLRKNYLKAMQDLNDYINFNKE